MIGAHPDDEDTSLLAALSLGMGVETAYLSLTRGEGGQNLIGPELDEGLGLVRTGELLAARSLDGAQQFFTRAFDFGYSKTAEETFRYWPRAEILADVTWVVRTFRPQVIISVFSGTPRDGHGHHQVAGILAHEVFDVAGDPSQFPDQIRAGVRPWTPSKLYRLTRRDPQEGTTGIETGRFDPLLGRSFYQVAMESRSQHRSQDMGVPQPMGPRRSTVALVKSRGETAPEEGIFTGVDTALLELARGLPQGLERASVQHLERYREAIAEAEEALHVQDPWDAAPPLGRALVSLRDLLALLETARGEVRGSEQEGVETVVSVIRNRLPRVHEALLRASGVVVDVRADDDLLVPGETLSVTVEIWNGGPFPLRSRGGDLHVPDGWSVSPGPAPEEIPPESLARWNFRVQVPESAPPSAPYFLLEPREGELYRWPTESGIWAAPTNCALFFGHLSLDLGEMGPVDTWVEGRYRGVDKATGEFVEPVQLLPGVSVSLDPAVLAWPSGPDRTREITMTLRSFAEGAVEGEAGLSVPEGWSVDPERQRILLPEMGSETSVTFRLTRPPALPEGDYSVAGTVLLEDGRRLGSEVVLVDYPHIQRGLLVSEARSEVAVLPVSLPAEFRVGYVMGSGDLGPEALRQVGARVDLLDSEALRGGDLGVFDAIVLGIRAYETRPDLAAANDRLLDYARAGGTLVVQYNKYEFPRGGFAPYPVDISRPHDRVTDETAPVRILDPEHPVFNVPNKIDSSDFEGWVQERGLYFLGSWDQAFTPLLEMADPGEEPKRGGLLVARLGDGYYVYTGLAFFRQFPEGVHGAYRLFANLVSLGTGDPN
jgi:LmbE family N-acetylglucosaminyl deacetylase